MSIKKNKKIILLILCCIVLAAVVLLILEKTHVTNIVHNPFYHAQSDPKSVTNSLTKNDPSTQKDKGATQNTDNSTATTTNEVPVSNDASISIGILAENENYVSYSASISGSVADGGTCTLTFTHMDAKPVVVTDTAKNMTCTNASIPVQQFTMLGTWSVTLRYFYNNQQLTTASEITIQ